MELAADLEQPPRLATIPLSPLRERLPPRAKHLPDPLQDVTLQSPLWFRNHQRGRTRLHLAPARYRTLLAGHKHHLVKGSTSITITPPGLNPNCNRRDAPLYPKAILELKI